MLPGGGLAKADHFDAEVEGNSLFNLMRALANTNGNIALYKINPVGNTEYKYKLTDLTDEQLEHRVTQLNWFILVYSFYFIFLNPFLPSGD